jgi:hypothetical protein
VGCVGTRSKEEEMATAGARAPLASGPRGVDVGVQSGPLEDGGVRALADTGDSARAGEAQVARERAPQQRGEAQGATLLGQAEEENKASVVPGHPLREVVCYTHAIAAASGATGSDSPYSIVTTR